MSDQILTQEEIDALLSAMDKGEVDLEENGGRSPASPGCRVSSLDPQELAMAFWEHEFKGLGPALTGYESGSFVCRRIPG